MLFVLSLKNFQIYETLGFANNSKLKLVKGLIEQVIKDKIEAIAGDLTLYTSDGCLIEDSY